MEIAADNSSSDSTLMVIQIVQQYLQQIGINAEIKSYDPASWLDLRKSGDMVSFVSSWTADYNDPDNFIYTFLGTPEKSNVRSLNYFNTYVMSRVAAARGIVDDTERLTEYAALEKQIVEEDAGRAATRLSVGIWEVPRASGLMAVSTMSAPASMPFRMDMEARPAV